MTSWVKSSRSAGWRPSRESQERIGGSYSSTSRSQPPGSDWLCKRSSRLSDVSCVRGVPGAHWLARSILRRRDERNTGNSPVDIRGQRACCSVCRFARQRGAVSNPAGAYPKTDSSLYDGPPKPSRVLGLTAPTDSEGRRTAVLGEHLSATVPANRWGGRSRNWTGRYRWESAGRAAIGTPRNWPARARPCPGPACGPAR